MGKYEEWCDANLTGTARELARVAPINTCLSFPDAMVWVVGYSEDGLSFVVTPVNPRIDFESAYDPDKFLLMDAAKVLESVTSAIAERLLKAECERLR